jgi:hypothetical protein
MINSRIMTAGEISEAGSKPKVYLYVPGVLCPE